MKRARSASGAVDSALSHTAGAEVAQRALELVAENPRLRDVRLVCQDGVTVDSSVLVLAAVSPVLEALLLRGFQEAGQQEVTLPAVHAAGLAAQEERAPAAVVASAGTPSVDERDEL